MIRKQHGFTTIELTVALVITTVIGLGTAMTVSQMFSVHRLTANRETAVKQVENAVFRINNDVQMAQNIQTSGPSGFPLTMGWTDWDNTVVQVLYNVTTPPNDVPCLQRTLTVNGVQQPQSIVARYVDTGSEMTNCEFVSPALEVKLSVLVGGVNGATETRSFQVNPRPGQS